MGDVLYSYLIYKMFFEDLMYSYLIYKKWFRRKRGLSIALLVAAWYSLSTPRASAGRIKAALVVWLDFWSKPKRVDRWTYFRRMRACHRCVLFCVKRSTCGDPSDKENGHLGCGCYMISKSVIKNATCWLKDNSDNSSGFGWPDEG